LGTVSIDGTKIDANASKLRSLHYDRAQALRNVTRHRHCRVERSRRTASSDGLAKPICRWSR
jgi:hypothetical protein